MTEEMRTGLSDVQAKESLAKYGKNEIASEKKFVGLKIFLSQLKSPLVYVLLFAAVVTFFLKEYIDTGVILFAVVINTILGFIQEFKAEKSLDALKEVLAPKALVYRSGEKVLVRTSLVVPGDVVFLSDEHKVPADGILLEEDGLFTMEAILTGESAPVEKYDWDKPDTGEYKDLNDMREFFEKVDNKHKAFMGTQVKMGVGRMLVVRTGRDTAVGRVAETLKQEPAGETPLQMKVARLSKQLAVFVGVISVIVLIAGLATGKSLAEIFPTAVALAVAAIPEGLVVSLTVILAIGMQRILRRKAVVRRLTAAETLGSVDVICADKTGTLTEGVMRVTEAITNLSSKSSNQGEKEMILAAVLCNDMRDPLEIGMNDWAKIRLSKVLGVKDSKDLRKKYDRVDSLPFDSSTRYIATLHNWGKKKKIYVSGAPEMVLEMSKLNQKQKQEWMGKLSEMGKKGYRLVGFAQKSVGDSVLKVKRDNLTGLEWVGVLVYEDPVRKGVGSVLQEVKKAGVSVKVITGDYRETAVAILRQIGLLGEKLENKVLEGSDLEKLSEEKLATIIDDVVLFARTTPDQKLKIVGALKDKGHVVAMTGDGVNDAPALKRADIGIVVSDASDVSKEAADVVLLDNNFKTIVWAIEEGRGIYANLKKIIVYLLADAFAEIIVIVMSMVLGWPLPLLAVQILWINLVSDGFPDLALTVEPREKNVLREKPRKKSDGLVDGEVLTLIVLISITAAATTLGVFAWYWHSSSYGLDYARTMAFAMLGVNSLFYVFSSRSLSRPIWQVNIFRNPWLIAAVFGGLLLQVSAIYVPLLQKIFRTEPLDAASWGVIIAGSLLLIVIVEVVKAVYLKMKK